MVFKVLKSQIGDRDFAAEVEAHCKTLAAHLNMIGVSPPGAPDQLVESAISRVSGIDLEPTKFIADFEIIDDTPPPPTAEELKLAAINESRLQEQAQIDALLGPVGLRRLRDMEYARATQAIHEAKVKGQMPSAEAQKIVNDYATLHDQIKQVQYAGALREAAIERGD